MAFSEEERKILADGGGYGERRIAVASAYNTIYSSKGIQVHGEVVIGYESGSHSLEPKIDVVAMNMARRVFPATDGWEAHKIELGYEITQEDVSKEEIDALVSEVKLRLISGLSR
jgi:hypothetical protein